jgi:hypothetical protein
MGRRQKKRRMVRRRNKGGEVKEGRMEKEKEDE